MEAEFWNERWQRGEIGFHKSRVNPLLQRWWPVVDIQPQERVLVPLCGKSLDMLWLRDQSCSVMGVELSRLALDDFVAEHRLACQWSTQGDFDAASCDGLTLYCGDFFALTAEQLKGVTAVYDRAALIALPPSMRQRYVAHMRELLPGGWRLLLITLDYAQQERPGPPFSVPDVEVRELFAGCSITVLQEEAVLDVHPVFREQGMTSLYERVYLISAG